MFEVPAASCGEWREREAESKRGTTVRLSDGINGSGSRRRSEAELGGAGPDAVDGAALGIRGWLRMDATDGIGDGGSDRERVTGRHERLAERQCFKHRRSGV